MVGQFVDLALEVILKRKDAPGIAINHPPGIGEGDAAPAAVEQSLAQTLLEGADLKRHRGLRHAELIGCVRERALVHDRAQSEQVTEIHWEEA